MSSAVSKPATHKNCTACERLLPNTREYFSPCAGNNLDYLRNVCRSCVFRKQKATIAGRGKHEGTVR
jgi:hypothetical protein